MTAALTCFPRRLRLPAALAAAALCAGTALPAPFSATLASAGDVEVTLCADEERVSPERDFHVTITAVCPAGREVVLPGLAEMRGRFQGFSLAEGFRREPEKTPDGRVRAQDRWRLVPEPAARCRLAPFAVVSRPAGGAPGEARDFATSPAVFPVLEPAAASGDVELAASPFRIPPSPRAVFGWAVSAVLALAAAVLACRLAGRVRRAARLRRMSPSERAFAELEALLGMRLAEKGLFKDFYVGLTHVVRRYIERSHGIRAPEQTTEEFLAAAKTHPRFAPAVLRSLADFLRSADMVKFARKGASVETAGDAVGTAKKYIETDTEETRRLADAGKAAGKGARGGGRP